MNSNCFAGDCIKTFEKLNRHLLFNRTVRFSRESIVPSCNEHYARFRPVGVTKKLAGDAFSRCHL